MSILDRFTGTKRRNKRTFREIKYDKILSKQQNMILESALAANEALKMEVKSLRQVLFDQDDLYRDLGVAPIEVNQGNSSLLSSPTGEFNTADLIANIAKGIDASKVPGGKIALQAFSEFIVSNSQEVNSLGSHYIKQAMPKQEIKPQEINQ
jgi:hypothetical protein